MLKVLAAAVTRALVWRRVDIFVTATPHLSRRGVRCQLGRNVPLDNVNIGITTQDTDHSSALSNATIARSTLPNNTILDIQI